MTPRPFSALRAVAHRRRAAIVHGLAFLGYTVLTLLYLRPAARVLATHLAPDAYDPLFNLVVLKWGIRQWLLGLPDFWNMPFFFPARQVATYSDHLLGPSALATLFTAVVPNALAAYNALFLGSFALCGWTCWYVLRRSGLGVAAAFLGGCMFAFAPFRWDQLSHLQILLMQWIPLTLWTWDRLLAAPGWRRALAFLPFYVLHVTGGMYLAYMIHIPLAIQLLCRLPTLRRERPMRALRVLVPVGLFCALLLFVLFRPYLGSAQLKKRNRSEIQIYSASVLSYLTPGKRNLYEVVWPNVLFRAENVLFPGIAVSLLAIAAARRLRRERPTRSSAFAALARRKQAVLIGLGLLTACAWGVGEARTWALCGRVNLARVDFSTFSTYRMGMVVICAGLLAWFLWARWTLGRPRFLERLDPWRRGLLISGVACFLLSFPMIYLPSMKILPGLSGMRVPARFFPFVLFPLVLLAATELDRRWRAARPERRRALVTVAAALVLVEVIPHAIDWERLPAEHELAPVYQWLARQPAVDGLLELPIGDHGSDIFSMYAMSAHWKPLVNGYSGYIADHYARLQETCCHPLPDPEQLDTLRNWGVTHVLLHETRLTKRWERRIAGSWAENPGVSTEFEDGVDRVYRIAPRKADRDR